MPTSSNKMTEPVSNSDESLGDPDCPICKGTGYVRYDHPVGHPDFGKLQVCTCRQLQLDRFAYSKLFAHSQLDELNHLTFENFEPRGKGTYAPVLSDTIEQAYEAARQYATQLNGWLLLQGGYGCGKTHLAAAIANFVVELGIPTLFVTAPDLLDLLRFSFNDPETTFEQRFKDFREVRLLVLDDFGTHNATPWAQEKFFQILNHRYINKLPLVITTNQDLDEIDARIRSRLQDTKFVHQVTIQAPDYRLRGDATSNPALSSLSLLADKTFFNFLPREDELGKEVKSRIIKETDRAGKTVIETIKTRISAADIRSLKKAFESSIAFAEHPEGWLVLLGESGCGKTHLASAIGNYRISSGAPAILVDVPDLMDYLRATYNSNAVTYQQRMNEVKNSPLLLLDSFGKTQPSQWVLEKLYQILNHRANQRLPTLVVSHLTLEEIEQDYSTLFARFLDTNLCSIHVIGMPMYIFPARKTKSPRKK
jgi:DNA replication protein DnaC